MGEGSLVFARYAFSPNKLRYCGPDKNRTLFEYAAKNTSDQGLFEILEDFEGAYPYLQFIAQENHIKDPLDLRVVEAYWLGNGLLNNVNLNSFYEHIKNRFSERIDRKSFGWLVQKVPKGAKPYHAFHVFEIYTRMGGVRDIDLGPIVQTINNCVISFGKIVSADEKFLEIKFRPIVIDKKIHYGNFESKKIAYNIDGKGFIKKPKRGDWVSIHWDWACDILDRQQLENLQKWTNYHIKIANSTI